MAKDDQDAGSSRAVDSDNQSVLHKSSARAASTSEKVPTTSPAAERSSESAVSVVQRPLPQTVRTQASSAATNKSRALLAQGNTRSYPRLPLIQLPPHPKETVRPSPSRRRPLHTVDRYTPYTVHTTHILYNVRTMYFVCSPDSDFTSVHHSYSYSSHTYYYLLSAHCCGLSLTP